MNDTQYIIGLMKENYEAVSFIPSTTIEKRYIAKNQYILVPRKGYLLHGVGVDWHISQAVIEYDLRNRGHGIDMVDQLIQRANDHNARRILLRCADDLAANQFWKTCGFEIIRTFEPDNQRKRKINLFEMSLQLKLFDVA